MCTASTVVCTKCSDVRDVGCLSTLVTNILKLQLTACTSVTAVSCGIPSSKIMGSKLKKKTKTCTAVKYINLKLVASESEMVNKRRLSYRAIAYYHSRGKFSFVRGSRH